MSGADPPTLGSYPQECLACRKHTPPPPNLAKAQPGGPYHKVPARPQSFHGGGAGPCLGLKPPLARTPAHVAAPDPHEQAHLGRTVPAGAVPTAAPPARTRPGPAWWLAVRLRRGAA